MSALLDELARCRGWIEAALEYTGGTHDFEDILDAVIEGRMQFWPGRQSAAITELLQYPKKRALHVFLAGGDLDEVLIAIPSVEDWGRQQGCSELTMTGRLGWERVLQKEGWVKLMTTMGKPL